MRSAVHLAVQARSQFCSERPDVHLSDVKIALSLGPLGATLTPTQEYGGFYPPPYGPRAYDATSSMNTNVFLGDNAQTAEREAELALMDFHFDRLVVFADDEDTWGGIDCVLFETIPLLWEVRGIKRAVEALRKRIGEARMKWWSISSIFPDGIYPQMTPRQSMVDDGSRVSAQDVVRTALEKAEFLGIPDALGINCTPVECLPALLKEMEEVLQTWDHEPHPWIVLCPNGGDRYDRTRRAWVEDKDKADWAKRVVLVTRRMSRKLWGGFMIGGCCRAGPREIKDLNKQVRDETTDQGIVDAGLLMLVSRC